MKRLALALLAACGSSHARAGTCPEKGAAVVVETAEHALWLCEHGNAVHRYDVSLGTAGAGKQREGDNKTPLGAYSLGTPRASSKFNLFIPVGYPTAEQRKQGFTGGAIGIHGPSRRTSWLGRFNTWTDWTQGCIAVGTDDDIAAIAAWVERASPAQVVISP